VCPIYSFKLFWNIVRQVLIVVYVMPALAISNLKTSFGINRFNLWNNGIEEALLWLNVIIRTIRSRCKNSVRIGFYEEPVFFRRFRKPIWVSRIENLVPRISENYHRIPWIRGNRVARIREIRSLQIHTGYQICSLKKKLGKTDCKTGTFNRRDKN